MLTLPASVRIYLATGPVDLRKSIDGLGALASARGHDVFSGHLFVFTSRRGDRVKILVWDRGGFVLYYKRLLCGAPHNNRYAVPVLMRSAREDRSAKPGARGQGLCIMPSATAWSV
jgi:hypothetical protein